MRRPLILSAAAHAGLAAALVLGGWLAPRALPVPEETSVELVTQEPVRVQARQVPAAEAAPLPKQEATAVDPGPRTTARAVPTPPPASRAEPKPSPAEPPKPDVRSERPPPASTPEVRAKPPAEPRPASRPATPPAAKASAPTPDKVAARTPEPERPAPRPEPRAAAPRPESKAVEARPEPRPATPRPEPRAATPRPDAKPPAKPAATKPPTPAKADKPSPPRPAQREAEQDTLAAIFKAVEDKAKRVEAPEARPGRGSGATPPAAASIDPSRLAGLVRDQVTPCWSIPAGMRDAATMEAELDIRLGPDGSVQRVAPVDTGRMERDTAFRIFVESAVRAVKACSPLELPSESYQAWRHILFNFDAAMTG